MTTDFFAAKQARGDDRARPHAARDEGELIATRRGGRRGRGAVTLVIAAATSALLALAGCAAQPARWKTPPAGGLPDYQLGGAYDPDSRVAIVARDRTAQPAAGAYSICYINGFQTQPGELDAWPDEALLRAPSGEVHFDPDWPDEALLDTSSADSRSIIAETVAGWIRGCARAGFDAVEFDNLDSYSRSDGTLSFADNLALATELVAAAHREGLAAGQKNAPDHAAELRERAGFDFAVTEECNVFTECAAYTSVYGEHVIDIEYTAALPRPFAEMCADEAAPRSMVLRDRPLSSPGDPGYAFELCG